MYPLAALWVGVIAQGPDSATRVRARAALTALDDSLTALESVASGFPADLGVASPDLVTSRSERLRRRCRGADSASAQLLGLLPPGAQGRRDLGNLRIALARCDSDFTATPAQPADSLKAWAPYRLARLGEAVRRYRRSVGVLKRENATK